MFETRSFVHRVSLLACGWVAAAAGTQALAQTGDWEHMRHITPRGYVCGLANAPPMIDGQLDESAWQAAAWTRDFVDIEGDRQPQPRQRTRAKLLWDNDYLYIGAELDETHVWGTLTDHDAVIFQDNDFEVFIDPDGDNHEYYELELNALNTTWDLFLPRPYKDGGQADNSWEIPGLKTAVQTLGTLNDPRDDDRGWSVEIAIPWTALRQHSQRSAPPHPGDTWRINFSRVEWQHDLVDGKYRKVPDTRENNWVWSPPGIVDMHRPERWGFVQFSREAPSSAEFVMEPNWRGRELLMEVYHRQKSFHTEHGKWAGSLGELGFVPTASGLQKRLVLQATPAGFQASLAIPMDAGPPQHWHVRQDSRLWMSPANPDVDAAFERAGANRLELQRAWNESPTAHREAMEFLIANMPDRDLQGLSADFLLENVRLAYQAWDESPWKNDLPKEIFLNNVLPYANINERRDTWRKDFRERFLPLIQDARTPSLAAARLNQTLFPLLKVRYSTQRPKADQSPYESIQSGTASCTGLSVLLIDACRAVGVPARFVGTPLWSDKSGNHSWVEVWDQGWHFTGAAEPAGDQLDNVWFLDRAAAARREDPRHAIYAVSFQRTPLKFPLIWDRQADYVSAVNVTDRYVDRAVKPPAGTVKTMLCVRDRPGGPRVPAAITVLDQERRVVFEGTTKDERFDANDHLSIYLPADQEFQVEVRHGPCELKAQLRAEPRDTPWIWHLNPAADDSVDSRASGSATGPSGAALAALALYLAEPIETRTPVDDQPFAHVALTKDDAAEAARLLWQAHVAQVRQSRTEETKSGELKAGDLTMRFAYEVFGEIPKSGRSLFISLHGGGGAPAEVNDRQWENQKTLYRLEEGVYLVPRAPTNTWDLWHQAHIDGLFDRLIENLIVLENVDPNRVYLLGYSAGGDGVYQLAPRMADRWAAAAMMAGHPNETSPLGLRNVAFTIHMGELDAAYSRNHVASQWEQLLAELQRGDPAGYVHSVQIHKGKGHWMDREDAVAIPWMAKVRRNPVPERIVWKQDDVVRTRFYWLAVDPADIRDRAEVIARRDGQQIDVQSKDVDRITIRLSDEMVDLEQPVSVTHRNRQLFCGPVARTIATLATTLKERGDPQGMFSGEVTVALAPPADAGQAATANQPLVVEIWPGEAPDEPGTIGPEIVRMSPKLERKQVEVTESTRLITRVTKPAISIYRPAKDKDTGTAMLICPGGGYWDLYWELEGEEVAAWLNSQGITGIVLKYRVPRRPDEPENKPARRPLQDAQRALSLVRSRAQEWGIHPERIGIVGFSAGGHLAISTATNFEQRSYEPRDDVDKVSCRPDFAVPIYPGYLKAPDKNELESYLRVPAGTPPVFLAHGGDDIVSSPEHSVLMYLALKRAGIPTELHVYSSTTHDFGVRASDRPYSKWTDSCIRWLTAEGLLKPAPGP